MKRRREESWRLYPLTHIVAAALSAAGLTPMDAQRAVLDELFKLTPPMQWRADRFGVSVAISDNTAIVGADDEGSGG